MPCREHTAYRIPSCPQCKRDTTMDENKKAKAAAEHMKAHVKEVVRIAFEELAKELEADHDWPTTTHNMAAMLRQEAAKE